MKTCLFTSRVFYFFAFTSLFTPQVFAELKTTGNLTAIGQYIDDSEIKNGLSLSVDINSSYASEKGKWWMHIEANNSIAENSVANIVDSANSDANTAVNANDKGRVQLSELFYQFYPYKNVNFSLGLMNAGAFLDTSNVHNDENTQFINATLVNNPVIDFPDYALAGAVQLQSAVDTTLFVSSTHGLADNSNRDYSQLFEVGEDDKGVFVGLEVDFDLQKTPNSRYKLGSWVHSYQHETLVLEDTSKELNYGFYGVVSYQYSQDTEYEARVGFSSPKVNAAKRFFSIAQQTTWNLLWTTGLGFSRTDYSEYSQIEDAATSVLEGYVNYALKQGVLLGSSIQYIDRPQFSLDTLSRDNIVLWNLRLNVQI